MIYREFKEMKLSGLGMGNMRLPVIDGDDSRIDEPKAAEIIDYAYDHGINYFDTAWGYHGGNSELVVGRALKKYPRDTFYLADKFPGYDLSNMPKVREIFEQQLVKCQVDYFDFYLFHNVCEMNIDAYLDPQYGIYDYLMEQKKKERIRHLGFSCHGRMDVLKRFLEAYGKDMEFCQIQLNWLDWSFQDAKEKVELLKSWNIPVWVMEPLRGGKLLSQDPEAVKALNAVAPGRDLAEWSFRFLQAIPGVTVVLSGMTAMDQIKENVKIWESDAPLSEAEMAALEDLSQQIQKKGTLPCTACHYCTSHCPKELDIPYMMSLYNEHVLTGGGFIAPMALMAVDRDHWPTECLHCHSCEEVCPQQLKISDMMEKFAGMLS